MTLARQVMLFFALLLLMWLIWSGYFKPLLVFFGIVSCTLVVVLTLRMETATPQDRFWLRLLPRLPQFWLWLTAEVVKSNVHLAAIILDPRLPISPRLVTIDAEPVSQLGQATLGNCITLTPGTVTLDDHDGKLQVHCITASTAAGLQAGDMNRRVAALTGA